MISKLRDSDKLHLKQEKDEVEPLIFKHDPAIYLHNAGNALATHHNLRPVYND